MATGRPPGDAAPSPELPRDMPAGPGRPAEPLLSVVVPVFCEESGLERFTARVEEVAGGLANVRLELVFVNDGSTDGSLAVLEGIAAGRAHCRVVDLARNFGKEAALSAGLRHAQGDLVVCIDADLQHPPELIADMVSAWRAGAEIVATVRRSMVRQSWLRRASSWLFYWLMHRIAEIDLVAKSTDFCLLDRSVVDAYNAVGERSRSFRGLLQWLGYRRVWLEFDADAREHGRPRYSYGKLLELAVTNLIAYSSLPLRAIGYLGGVVTMFSGALLAWMLVTQALGSTRYVYTPLAMFVVGNTFVMGVVLTTLGVMALYIAKIHREVSGRPLYVVRTLINAHPDDAAGDAPPPPPSR